jgi:membrane protease YdiL (CAAX protease family)
MKKFLGYAVIPSLVLLPLVALAQQFGKVDGFFQDAGKFINDTLIPIILAIAFLIFIIGAVRFFLLAGKDNEDGQKNGKNLMLWGIIGFVLIVSIWGIITVIAEGLGFAGKDLEGIPDTPAIQQGSSGGRLDT